MDTPLSLWRRLRAEPRRRDAVDAVATALLGLVLIPLGMVDVVGGASWSPPDWAQGRWWHAVPLLAGCAALLAKRRRPVAVTATVVPILAVDIYLGGSIGMYVVLVDALYCLVLHARAEWVRPAIITIAVPIALAPVVTFVVTGDARATAFMLLQFFALLGTPVWWGLSVRQHAELANLERARAEDLDRLSALHRSNAVREERNRMAQDLHDALSSNLSTIAIHSGAVLHPPEPTPGSGTVPDRSRIEDSLIEIRAASVRALEDLREMILLLQTDQDQISPAAHLADLATLVNSARSTGLRVTVEGDPARLPPLPSVVDHAAYRILQESLANATKHAPGGQVAVRVREDGRRLWLEVRCRTPQPPAGAAGGAGGLRPAGSFTGSGMGLRTMRDRATTLGGTFEAGWGEEDERVWVVTAKLPLKEVVVR